MADFSKALLPPPLTPPLTLTLPFHTLLRFLLLFYLLSGHLLDGTIVSLELVLGPRLGERDVVAPTTTGRVADAVQLVANATHTGRVAIDGEGGNDPRAYTVTVLVEDGPATEGGAVVLEGKTSEARAKK